MKLRWILLALFLAATQIATAQDSLNWNLFAFPLTQGDQRGLETLMTDDALWKTIAQDTAHQDIKRVDIDLLREHLPISEEKTFPMMSVGNAEKGKRHDFHFIQGKPIQALEYIPETDPMRYLLKKVESEPEFTMRLKWNGLSPDNEVTFNVELTRSPIIGRETIEGSALEVGKPIRSSRSVKFKESVPLGELTTYLWKPADSPPLIIRVAATDGKDKFSHETPQQYALESKVLVVHGNWRMSNVSPITDAKTSKGFTPMSGSAVAFRTKFDAQNKARISSRSHTEFLTNKVLEQFKAFGVYATEKELGTASAPRVTSTIYDPRDNRFLPGETLFKMVLSNSMSGGGGGARGGSSSSNTRSYFSSQKNSVFELLGRYHDWFSPNSAGLPIILDEHNHKPFAMIADLATEAIRVGRTNEREFKTVSKGMLFVSRVTSTDQEETYLIDYFHLNRQRDKFPKSIKNTPEAMEKLEAGFQNSHFRYEYEAQDGETVGFFYSASPTEHYLVLNTMTVIDGNGARYFKTEMPQKQSK